MQRKYPIGENEEGLIQQVPKESTQEKSR